MVAAMVNSYNNHYKALHINVYSSLGYALLYDIVIKQSLYGDGTSIF